MNRATNYKLCQFEENGQVQRTDFNEDNAKLDGALAGKAEQSALNALTQKVADLEASKSEIKAGTYTGDGYEFRTIQLGFTPKAVLLFSLNGHTTHSTECYGGLALPGNRGGWLYRQLWRKLPPPDKLSKHNILLSRPPLTKYPRAFRPGG